MFHVVHVEGSIELFVTILLDSIYPTDTERNNDAKITSSLRQHDVVLT